MKRLVSIFLTLTLLMSLFSMVDVSALTNEKYLVDLIAEGNAIVGDLANYTPYQCDSAVKGGHTSEGVVRIGDGTETGYTDYSKGFRYHSASGGSARTITFAMPEGYNTISGIVGVCYHVPGVDSGNETHYCEECYVTITVNSASIYNSGAIKVKQGYPFKVRAREGSNVIISVINPTSNGSYNHVIFGDPKLSYEDYPDIDLSFDKPVYLAGETATPVITGSEADNYTIKWYLDGVELVVVGGESDRYARPLCYDWVLQVRESCVRKGVAFEFRQLGTHFVKDGKEYTIQKKDLCAQARKANINYQP